MKESMKRYIGIAGDALGYAFRRDTELQAGVRELDPPVGSKDRYGRGTVGGIIGGISTTTILLVVAAWYFLRR